MSNTTRRDPPVELPAVQAGVLPSRYGYRMQDELLDRVAPLLVPGARILDVGSGRAPTIAPADRPPGAWYVGLDISRDELDAAGAEAYDDLLVHDVTRPLAVEVPFDLAVSWQVLEHVNSLGAALETLRRSLRAGGTLVAQLSGRYAIFALAARALPHPMRVRAMARWLDHPPEEKFPTRYDRCSARALERLLSPWSAHEIIPYYRGATYLSGLRPLQRLYLAYESALERTDARNLATHYLIIAKR